MNEPIRIVLNLSAEAWPAAEPVVAYLKELEAGAAVPVAPFTNRQKVRGLIRRCELTGREIKVKDVIAVGNKDESSFHKWQGGKHVSKRIQQRFEEIVMLSADDFLSRLENTFKGN